MWRRFFMPNKIGVAITVHNRFAETDECVRRWRALLPAGAVMIVVDDGSDIPYPRADFRFEQSVGIARAKNKCLELLEDLDVRHAFLSDNDFWPIANEWWRPYIQSPEPHLSYQFFDFSGAYKLHDVVELYRDDKHFALSAQRGCMLYYDLHQVLPEVGGFDPIYGRSLYEHTDLADRIHAAGLTTWRYADVVNSHKFWHSLDEHQQVKRTISTDELNELNKRNQKIFDKRHGQHYKAFVPYREEPLGSSNVLITTLLTSNVDPQRGVKWKASSEAIAPWLESVERGGWNGIVLADELKSKDLRGYSAKVVQVPASNMNVYYQRWLHIYQYLREHSEVQWVWCTDGSDVEILRDPFEKMVCGKLYVGVENGRVGSNWMKQNHPSTTLQRFIVQNESKPLLNAGVVGGDRWMVMDFAQQIVTLYNDVKSARFWNKETSREDIGDMAAFNKVAYESFGSNLIYGPEVTTEFGKHEDNGKAKFQHK